MPEADPRRTIYQAFRVGSTTVVRVGYSSFSGMACGCPTFARLQKYWSEWFTFLSHPEVKPDNNDAERAFTSGSRTSQGEGEPEVTGEPHWSPNV